MAIAAFALAGLGVGNIAPVLFAGGGRAEPGAPGRGIAAVTTMGYSGFLLGPPIIGMAAEWTGLALGYGVDHPRGGHHRRFRARRPSSGWNLINPPARLQTGNL